MLKESLFIKLNCLKSQRRTMDSVPSDLFKISVKLLDAVDSKMF